MIDFSKLPIPSNKNIAVKVKPAAERAIKQGHPWIFEDAITKQSAAGQSGDLAIIYDKKKDKFLAIGLYDPDSPIRIKILQSGKPARINQVWFEEKFKQAQAIRQPLIDSGTTGYRLVYGESDSLPALIIDRYSDTLVMKLYTLAWFPHLQHIISALQTSIPFERLVLRLSRSIAVNPYGLTDGQILIGDPIIAPIQFIENGFALEADVIHGHKTGFFFDQRDNRQRVQELADGKNVLDIFSYVGAFTVYALAGGATSVTALDISQPAMQALEANVLLNDFDPNKVTPLVADAFDGMHQLAKQGKQYELVIVDPPSFAKSQAEVERALISYQRLVKLALPLVAPDGILVIASCSSRIKPDVFFNLIANTANREGYRLDIIEKTSHALDHPIGFPEAEYLKAIFARVH
jgi:23S rRNA (cytosine1962-C5)-methyltransferase